MFMYDKILYINQVDWNELIWSRKEVKSSDQYICGNVMAEYKTSEQSSSQSENPNPSESATRSEQSPPSKNPSSSESSPPPGSEGGAGGGGSEGGAGGGGGGDEVYVTQLVVGILS
jgi:uncharacterized membrane protein